MSRARAIDTTEGNYKKLLWKLAWPVAITNLIQVGYNWADSIWVSRMESSTQAIAAVSTSFAIIFVLIAIAVGLSSATTTLVSQYFGAKDTKNVMTTAYTSLTTQTLLAAGIVIIGLVFKKQLFWLLKTPEEVLPFAYEYFSIIIVGMLFMFIMYVLSGILRGLGDTKMPMIIGIVSGVLNAVLDPFLIFGWGPFPELGIAGAAYATVFARLVSVVILIYKLFLGKFHFRLQLKEFRIDRKIFWQLWKIGWPAAVSQALLSLGGTLLIRRVNEFGDIAAAAHGIGRRLDSFLFTIGMSLNQAVATVVGQNLGAGKKERAKKAANFAVIAAMGLTFAVGMIFVIYPKAYLFMFSTEEAVSELAAWYVRFLCLGYGFLAVRIVINGVFIGSGDTITQMIMTIVSLLFFRIPFAYAFSYTSLQVRGVWLGISASFLVSALIMYIVFKRNRWTEKAVTVGWIKK